MDIYSKHKRSAIMRAVKGKETDIEKDFRKRLSAEGLRYRKNVSYLKGKPDIAFIGKKIAVFLDSCFWHGCKKHYSAPSTNKQFWNKKINSNAERDKKITAYYRKNNWRVIRVWEHDLKTKSDSIVSTIQKEHRK